MTTAEITALKMLFRKSFKVVPGGPAGTTGGTRSQGVIASLDALVDAIAKGSATAGQWVAGEQKAFSLVYDDGAVYLVRANLANSTIRPASNPTSYLLIGPGGAGGSGAPFADDITVSLAGGRTFGKYQNGQTIPATGKTANEVILLAAIEDILPTYTTASVSVAQSAPAIGEVGESVSNTITGTFNRGDAGAVTAMRAYRGNQAQIGASNPTSPIIRTVQMVRALTPSGIWAVADYAAGAPKSVAPAGTPDTRPAQVRSLNAPQAAEVGLSSPIIYFTGYYKVFFGYTSAAPTTSAQVRQLRQSALTSEGNTVILETGTTEIYLAFAPPPGQRIISVFDLDNQGANITAQYILQAPVSVADAGGTTQSRPVYLYTLAGPYVSPARHSITYGT
jgi:hypothetical protein